MRPHLTEGCAYIGSSLKYSEAFLQILIQLKYSCHIATPEINALYTIKVLTCLLMQHPTKYSMVSETLVPVVIKPQVCL